MHIGIDIGGTFTDAVLIDGTHIITWAKRLTCKENLLRSLLEALDAILPFVKTIHKDIEAVTLSTTIVTNLIVEGKEDFVDLYIIPGPGAAVEGKFPITPYILKGYTDHCGQKQEVFREESVRDIVAQRGISNKKAAVSAKFSVRNPEEEKRLCAFLKELGYEDVSEGAKLHGGLNFIRRTNSAYYNSAVMNGFALFKRAVEEALQQRCIEAPLYILKADGGSLPMEAMCDCPVEAIFTGPSASILGMEALLSMPKGDVIAIDIGGTTSDISLWHNGKPLMARGGISIKGYPSAVRSYQVYSVGIGGDSAVTVNGNGQLFVGPKRYGPAMALGGPVPTLGDALLYLQYGHYGDSLLAKQAMESIQQRLQISRPLDEIAHQIINLALATINEGIAKAVNEENKKPIYVVEDIINYKAFKMEHLVLVGGTAEMLRRPIEQFMTIPVHIPEAAAVANAIGAAMAQHTISISLYGDTKSRTIVVPELGVELPCPHNCTLVDLIDIGKGLLGSDQRKGQKENMKIDVLCQEEFTQINGWSSDHKRLFVAMQVQGGVRHHVQYSM